MFTPVSKKLLSKGSSVKHLHKSIFYINIIFATKYVSFFKIYIWLYKFRLSWNCRATTEYSLFQTNTQAHICRQPCKVTKLTSKLQNKTLSWLKTLPLRWCMAFAVLNIRLISHLYLEFCTCKSCHLPVVILFCDVIVPRWIITYPDFTKVNWN